MTIVTHFLATTLGVQVMGNGTIDGLHILAVQESPIICRRERESWNTLFKPGEGALVRVAGCHNNRPGVAIG